MQEACGIRPCDVLAFWLAAGPDRWFTVDEAFDTEVRRRFLKLWQAAKDGELSSWEASDDGLLALAIVLDQFPRNMFRGDPRAYASDREARDVAVRAIERGVDSRVDPALRAFLYMPLMHSENLTDQERCIELFRDADNAENLNMRSITPISSAGSADSRIVIACSDERPRRMNRLFWIAVGSPLDDRTVNAAGPLPFRRR
jgi:uncharacterized protein (DUF924 family)